MDKSASYLCFVGLFCFLPCVFSQCSDQLPPPQKILETEEPYYELFNLSGTDVVWSYHINKPSTSDDFFRQYFNLDLHNETYTFSINKTLDLEDIYNKTSIRVSSITMAFYCTRNGVVQNYDYFLRVMEVNEFPPNFINPPFVRNVTEDTGILSPLIILSQHAEDKDINQTMNEIQGFEIHDFNETELDGQTKFEMPRSQDGLIRLKEELDYEAMEEKFYILNVSVEDRGGLMDFTTVTVNVIDVDDLPPEFYYEGCQSKPCSVLYQTSLEDDYTGELDKLTPAPIFARDRDTLDYPVRYSIVNGDYPGIVNYFSIDPETGVVNVIHPLQDISHSSFSLTIQAEEDSVKRHSTTTFLWVTILGRQTAGPSTQIVTQMVRAGDDTLKITMIVLAVIIFIIIIAFIISIFFVRKRYRKSVSPLDLSPAGSEKGTDDEELSISESDNWPSPIPPGKQERIVASLPEGRGSLPPIQYVETGNPTQSQYQQNITSSAPMDTTLERKSGSKRSRKRNRDKEPEVYDGTVEYNDQTDADFYTIEKNKVKLSSRSRNTDLDTKYWITVDNDY